MIISKTPLRISFFGGGSDLPSYYKKEGYARVLCATINKFNYVVANPISNRKARFSWQGYEEVENFNAVKSLIVQETTKFLGIENGLDIHSLSDVTGIGSGLGSSSAFTVGLINVLSQGKSALELAREACHIELNLCHFPIGCQDQYACALGGLNLLEFNANGEISVEKRSLHDNFEEHLILLYTGIERNSIDILSKQNAHMLAGEPFKHEIIRTLVGYVDLGANALFYENYEKFGNLLHKAWMWKKQLVHEISNDRIDEIYKFALKEGAYGGKLLGAGGGGHMLFVVPNNEKVRISQALVEVFPETSIVDFQFTLTGSQVELI
jgi:D-glycero-alpha-D-manno-heptose-7-phosphate kinase